MPSLAGWEGARGSAGFELSWEPFVMGTPIKTVEDPQTLLFVWITSRARIRECSIGGDPPNLSNQNEYFKIIF